MVFAKKIKMLPLFKVVTGRIPHTPSQPRSHCFSSSRPWERERGDPGWG